MIVAFAWPNLIVFLVGGAFIRNGLLNSVGGLVLHGTEVPQQTDVAGQPTVTRCPR